MEHNVQGLVWPPDSIDRREKRSARLTDRPCSRQWIDPTACPRGEEDCSCFPHLSTLKPPRLKGRDAADHAESRWIGPAGVERRLSERAEQLWKKLAGAGTMPDSSRLPELLRPPFLSQSLLIKNAATEPAWIAFVGEALARFTGIEADSPASSVSAEKPVGARLVRLAVKSAQNGTPCRHETDLAAIGNNSEGNSEQILTRAIALPFAARGEDAADYSVVVVATWRRLLSAEETRALHREIAAAIDWMHRQGF